jgi:hypothetical protein
MRVGGAIKAIALDRRKEVEMRHKNRPPCKPLGGRKPTRPIAPITPMRRRRTSAAECTGKPLPARLSGRSIDG